MVLSIRGSFGAMKKTSGISKLDASRASRTERLHKRLAARVPSLVHDLLIDLVADGQPARAIGRERTLVGEPQAAIERNPAHKFRVNKWPLAAADLPDALVIATPVVAQPVEQVPQPRPAVVADRFDVLVVEIDASISSP